MIAVSLLDRPHLVIAIMIVCAARIDGASMKSALRRYSTPSAAYAETVPLVADLSRWPRSCRSRLIAFFRLAEAAAPFFFSGKWRENIR